jgi:hydrogenase-4 component B
MNVLMNGINAFTIGSISPIALSAISLLARPNNHVAATAAAALSALLIGIALDAWQSDLVFAAPAWLSIAGMSPLLKCDRLSAFFLLLLSCVSFCCAGFAPSYLDHLQKRILKPAYWACYFLFLGGMVLTLLSTDALTFIVAWELMALSSAMLVMSDFRRRGAQRAAFIYLVATRLSTLFLTAGFFVLHKEFASWSFSAWSFQSVQSWIAGTLCLTGFAIKGGLWPFHIWLPRAHPEAPAPVSALMSGVMVKLAVYGAIRLLVCGRFNCIPVIEVLFVLSTISAFWGILFALVQREIKRILAFSTVENIGLICLSLSLCLWARAVGNEQLAALALLACLVQILSHGLTKSLLFLCAGSIDLATHTTDLNRLGGLLKKMPLTGAFFLLGCCSISALPPLSVFFGKWCLYQSLLMFLFCAGGFWQKCLLVWALGVLACIGAIALAVFVRLFGVAFPGRPRTDMAAHARECSISVLVAMAPLAVLCPVPAFYISVCSDNIFNAVILSIGGMSVAMLPQLPLLPLTFTLFSLVCLAYITIYRRAPSMHHTWACGENMLESRCQVTADSFSQPVARLFSPLLLHRLEVTRAEPRPPNCEKLSVEATNTSVMETRVYFPLSKLLASLSRFFGVLQAGSIHLYLLYLSLSVALVALIGGLSP